jgi:GNAT superfamily N-acetyltransferase
VHPGPRKHRHLDLRYVLTSPAVAPAPAAGESQDVEWFRWHSAVAVAEPGLEGVLRAHQPGEPVLRPVRSSDARECADVYLRSRAFALADVPLAHDESDVRRWLADEVIGHLHVTVADLDGTVVGLMVLDGPVGGDGWIDQLYLDPAWMGRGLGARFLELAEQRHPTGLQLWTFEVNTAAQRFYERHGFVDVERTDGAGNAERAPDIRYHWRP